MYKRRNSYIGERGRNQRVQGEVFTIWRHMAETYRFFLFRQSFVRGKHISIDTFDVCFRIIEVQ